MKRFINLIVLNVFLLIGANVISEPIVCPEGRNCEIGLDKKIQRDLTYATLVAQGTFEAFSDAELTPLSDKVSLATIRFSVDKYYKGHMNGDELNLKIPVYTPLPAGSGGGEGKAVDALVHDLQRLERDLEQGRIDKAEYEAKRMEIRASAVRGESYGKNKFFIVPISRGGLDHSYRQADIPVVPGQQYVLFIFKSVNEERTTALFSTDIDLYAEENIQVVKRVLSMFDKDGHTDGAGSKNSKKGS